MAGDRDKTAGEAAREKAERREAGAGEQPAAAAPGPGAEAAKRGPGESEELGTGSAAASETTEEEQERSIEELQADVAAAREQLADTVEELSVRVDPRPKIDDAKQRAHEAGDTAKQQAPKVAAGLGALFLLVVLIRRRRNS
jgi:hypothetical protein